MNQLPTEILLIIVDEMSKDVFHITLVNKELNNITKERIKKEKVQHKKKYIEQANKKRLFDCFQSVASVEECKWLRDMYIERWGGSNFMSSVRFVLGNCSHQVAQTWEKYLEIQ